MFLVIRCRSLYGQEKTLGNKILDLYSAAPVSNTIAGDLFRWAKKVTSLRANNQAINGMVLQAMYAECHPVTKYSITARS